MPMIFPPWVVVVLIHASTVRLSVEPSLAGVAIEAVEAPLKRAAVLLLSPASAPGCPRVTTAPTTPGFAAAMSAAGPSVSLKRQNVSGCELITAPWYGL